MDGRPTGTNQRSFERHHPRTPTASHSPRLGVRNPNPKPQSLLSQERVKLYGLQIWPVSINDDDDDDDDIRRVHSNKNPSTMLEEKERGRMQGLPKIFEYPLLSQEWVG